MATQQLAGQDIFQFLRSEQVDRIHDAAEEITFKAGEEVYSQGEKADHFFVVLEGQVDLRLQPEKGVSLQIDELRKGAVFGSCVCLQMDSYALTARCILDSKILSVRAATLKKLMDEDLVMGYAIQTLISQAYFKRYIDTMKKLQAVVHSIPLEAT
jgi:CRP-like cAMP-binding protein